MASCSGFLSQPDFWQKEGDAPILKYNTNNWLETHLDEATTHARGWLASLGVEESRVDLDTTPLSSEGARIFRADADRTFRSEPNRVLMIKLLSFAQTKFGDYQQSMGYVAGLLLLFFDPATVFKALTVLNDHPKYLTGYWRGEATACAVDGYVCFNLLGEHLQSKMLQLGLLPETFVQKWFAGICIHHLPYHVLVHFLDRFFAAGNMHLFQFFLAFFDEFDADLMASTSNPEANQMLRFEGVPLERLQRVIERSGEERFVSCVGSLDIHKLRVMAFENHLCRRMQSANEGMWQRRDDEITFSDEED